ncbi:histidine phosphatase superfamily [Schizophyllum amplum]|uniref:Histidine phosphatase superfamily n=1 Tax=Schizophyllum amplum TaxID=97359 RepID=A0A550C6F7_9AGAR|nr:histidine phosphatase superfamily [Auriculariopsis ampla]
MAPPQTGVFEPPAAPYTYTLPQVPLDAERYPVAPQGLELEQVHVYVRHGERTPVGVRLAAPPASIPEHWIMCKTARQLQAAVAGTTGVTAVVSEHNDDFLRTRKVLERRDGSSAEGECLLGELTDLGRQSTYNFGKSLRDLYVDRLKFLPNFLGNREEVYFRSTNIPRTMESLQQIVHGLYPTKKCHPEQVPPLLVRNSQDENLVSNTYACKRLEFLKIGFAQAAAAAYNPMLENLDKKLSKYTGGPIRVDGKPRASGILDTIRASVAHGIKIPPEFEEKAVMDVLERAVVNEWFSGYKTEEVRRLGLGRLLDDMARKMQSKVEQGHKDPLKILVHSTHDTALAGLLSTLDVFDDKWPAFTSAITFELFKRDPVAEGRSIMQTIMSPFRTKSGPEHFVRVRYQNRNLPLPLCAEEGQHLEGRPEFCAMSVFKARVKELTPVDFEAECAPK